MPSNDVDATTEPRVSDQQTDLFGATVNAKAVRSPIKLKWVDKQEEPPPRIEERDGHGKAGTAYREGT